jgi:F0F1-type ATP synthase assembly protein I
VGQGAKQPDREPGKVNLPFAKIAKYLAIGLEIPSTIIGALVLGYLVDRQFGTSPWFTVVSAVLGFVGAVFRLIQYLKYFAGDRNEG